ncbi:NAD(P)-dependent oxidoreductase [Candidatus Pseudothioglobus singularis]|jgi:UDP-glucose 4-epimerase|nr:NAD(P)-dependent oxidoreductase [Candidatus Pseudothioglobus singularis]MDB4598730.1 NAD(P)-dependent oxidoreductase [Candidatus Pseudothioglobus singularis]
MRIAIIGGGGFLGRALIERLDSEGYELILIHRKSSVINYSKKHKFVPYEKVGDNVFDGTNIVCDVFINLAWKGVSGSDRNNKDQITYNIPLTLWSVELAKALNCNHWIGFGSQAEYGNSDVKLYESMQTNPNTLYGFSKVASSYSALSLCKAYEIKGTWVRLFDPYGPGDANYWFIPHLINSLMKGNRPELTKCEQLWDFIYIEDAVGAIVSLIEHKANGIFNLGSGSTVSLKEVVEHVRKYTKTNIKPLYGSIAYRKDQIMHLESSIKKITLRTGWTPKVSIKDGIRKTVDSIFMK